MLTYRMEFVKAMSLFIGEIILNVKNCHSEFPENGHCGSSFFDLFMHHEFRCVIPVRTSLRCCRASLSSGYRLR